MHRGGQWSFSPVFGSNLVVYHDNNSMSKKAHTIVVFSTFSLEVERSSEKYDNSINQFRLVNVAAERHVTQPLSRAHRGLLETLFQVIPAEVRSEPDNFLVQDATTSESTGTFIQAALPAYFPAR